MNHSMGMMENHMHHDMQKDMMNDHMHHNMSGGMNMSDHMMDGMSGGMNMSDHMMDGMMKMYFHAGVKATILFKGWKTDSVGTMVASFIGIFLMAFLYEGLKFLREYLYRKHYTSVNYSSVAVTASSASKEGSEMHKVVTSKLLSGPHILQTILHMVQLVISYFLMLIFMTFNIWLCIAVTFGAGVGYFAFGWKKAVIVDVSEHCH